MPEILFLLILSSTKIGEISDMTKCSENIVSQTLGFIIIFCAADLRSNKNAFLSCTNKVTIGDDVLLGWDVHVFDDNGGHTVLYDGIESKSANSSITIGDRVWLCSYCHLLAGSGISDGSIVAYKSLLTKKITESNVMVAGMPATIKRHNVEWHV